MKRMKYMIRCDIEGVTGVVSYEQAEPGKVEYEFGRRLFMADLTACVEGLLAGGAEEIVIYDEHYYGRNVDLTRLPQTVSVICGKPPYRPDWAGGLDESFSGVVLLGFHSKFGTAGGLLHHSRAKRTERPDGQRKNSGSNRRQRHQCMGGLLAEETSLPENQPATTGKNL